jgi:uncharacterized phage protein (TIGR01671 family)
VRDLKFRVYIPDFGKFEYFDLNNISFPERYLNSDKYPVQQYIGQNDIDNNLIYEGDLVQLHTATNEHTKNADKNHYGLYEIHWNRKYKLKEIKPNWFLKTIDNDCANFNIMKVVGNIFENENLLK